ncbi:hypothetical protein HOC01_02500 [archaeon]|jgi:hypothetical protein|nr:hypothetical protein [archaeon]MBT6697811.1 hypothetical protein [archaeon]
MRLSDIVQAVSFAAIVSLTSGCDYASKTVGEAFLPGLSQIEYPLGCDPNVGVPLSQTEQKLPLDNGYGAAMAGPYSFD